MRCLVRAVTSSWLMSLPTSLDTAWVWLTLRHGHDAFDRPIEMRCGGQERPRRNRGVTPSIPVADDRRLAREAMLGLALHVPPISARFASSCSANGTSERRRDQLLRATQHNRLASSADQHEVAGLRALTSSATMRPFSSSSDVACAMVVAIFFPS